MDYGRRDLADRLAAEYVLGTLRGPARRRFEALLGAHPALRDAVAQWQQRLSALQASVPAVEPPARAWRGIEARLFADAAAAGGWWQRLVAWRAFSGVATAAALVLALVVARAPEPAPPIVVVLSASADAPQGLRAGFVASVSADGGALVLRPLGDLALTPGRALELWAVPPQGAPRSLGVVGASGPTTLLRARLLRDTVAFAVSVEPAGGSPTGAPTGPIVSVGKLPT